MFEQTQDQVGPAYLLDQLIARFGLKNDAELSRRLEVAPPVISKIRRRRMPIGDSMLLNMHETFGLAVSDLRVLGAVTRIRGVAVAAA
jgi:hypothetical protein